MLTGLFMAFCLVTALWYVIGIGDAVIFRDRMQEAADSGAFTSAALHAKGMNFISACNLIMLVMVTIHIVAGVIQDATILTCLAAGLGCISCALACPKIPGAIRNFHNVAKAMKAGLNAMTVLEGAAAVGYPWLGTARAAQVGKSYGNQGRIKDVTVFALGGSNVPGLVGGSAGPVPLGLPVTGESYNELCKQLGSELGNLLGSIIPLPGGIGKGLGKLLGGVAGTFFKFRYCNDLGGGANDPYVRQQARRLGEAQDELRTGKLQDEANNANLPPGEQQVIPGLGGNGNEDLASQIDPNKQGSLPDKTTKWNGWDPWFDPGFDKGWGDKGFLVVDPSAGNGRVAHQVWAINTNPQYEDTNEDKVSFGAHTRDRAWAANGWQGSTSFGYYAQAEFYFDCEEQWGGDDCNADKGASFGIRWRARLRRVEMPNFLQLIAKFGMNGLKSAISSGMKKAVESTKLGKALNQTPAGAIAVDVLLGEVTGRVVDPLLEKLRGGVENLGQGILPTGLAGAYH